MVHVPANLQINVNPQGQKAFDGESFASLVIWFCCVLYSSIRTASNSQASRLTISDRVQLKDDSSKYPFHPWLYGRLCWVVLGSSFAW